MTNPYLIYRSRKELTCTLFRRSWWWYLSPTVLTIIAIKRRRLGFRFDTKLKKKKNLKKYALPPEPIYNTKIGSKHPEFQNISNAEQFIFLMSCKDRQILTWLGKFLHKSFNIRNVTRFKSCNSLYTACPYRQAILNIHVVKEMPDILFPIYIYIIGQWSYSKFSVICTNGYYVWIFTVFRTPEYVHLCLCYITMDIESIVSTMEACIVYCVRSKWYITRDLLYFIYVYTYGHFKRWWILRTLYLLSFIAYRFTWIFSLLSL